MAVLELTEAAVPPPVAPPAGGPSSVLLTIIAIATGALAANLYYAQPLIAFIGPELGIPPSLAGALVSVTQLGYGIGLFQQGHTFRIQYDIGHGFKVRTETGVESGGDVLYTFERK